VELWSRSPSEGGVIELYSSSFLRNRVNRHDLNLALGRVHVRPHPYLTPFGPAALPSSQQVQTVPVRRRTSQ